MKLKITAVLVVAILTLGASVASAATGYDIQSLVTELTIDPAAGTVMCVSELKAQVTAEDQRNFYFRIDPLDEITVSDESGTLPMQYSSSLGAVRVHYFDPPEEGETLVLTFFNAGVPECEPDPFSGMLPCSVTPELVYYLPVSIAPSAISFEDEDLEDTYIVEASITLPGGMEPVVSLEHVGSRENGDGTETHSYRDHLPTRTFSLSAAHYETIETESSDGALIRVHTLPDSGADAGEFLEISRKCLDFYSDRYGAYPFPVHAMAQVGEALAGGAAFPSATYYPMGSFLAGPPGSFPSAIFAHQLARQWWGTTVPVRERDAPWLEEGFARFSAYLFGEELEGPDTIGRLMDRYGQVYDYQVLQSNPGNDAPLTSRQILRVDNLSYYLITYEKGAFVLRMLRWVLGEGLFLDVMSGYVDRFAWDAVTTEDFIETAEALSGEDLGWFFDQWVYGQGMPRYVVDFNYGSSLRGGTDVIVTVEQTGEALFSMPAVLRVCSGPENCEDRLEWIDGPVHSFTYSVDGEPSGVTFDPDNLILRHVSPGLAGDTDFSGQVDGADLVTAAFARGASIADMSPNWIGAADLITDGVIDVLDLDVILANFGAHCNDPR